MDNTRYRASIKPEPVLFTFNWPFAGKDGLYVNADFSQCTTIKEAVKVFYNAALTAKTIEEAYAKDTEGV